MFVVRALQALLLAIMAVLVFGVFVVLAAVQASAGWFSNLTFDPFGRYARNHPVPSTTS